MKRIFLFTAILALALGASARPILTWLQTTADFGAFAESNGPAIAVFRAVNTGDAPLVVLGARANCGCTRPEYDHGEIAPGDTLTVSVTYDPTGRPGRFTKYVYVDTNTEPSRTKLTIKGVIIGAPETVAVRYPAVFGPLRLAHPAALLGQVTKGHVKSSFEQGYNTSGHTLRPVVRDTPKWLDVRCPGDSVGAGDFASLNFFIQPDKTPLYGIVTDTVTLVPDPEHSDESFRLPVVVTFEEDFSHLTDKELAEAPAASVDKDTQALGRVPAGTDATGVFSITNNGRKPLLIRRVYTTAPGVTFDAPDKIKPGQTGKITVTAPVTAAPLNIRIQLITNDPARPVRTLRLTAEPV